MHRPYDGVPACRAGAFVGDPGHAGPRCPGAARNARSGPTGPPRARRPPARDPVDVACCARDRPRRTRSRRTRAGRPAGGGPGDARVDRVPRRDRARKVLKAVDLGFLDHSTRERRRRGCEVEVEVNRRFAPDVYLGVVTLLGVDGEPVEHGILMRRLPDDRRLAALLDTDEGPDSGPRRSRTASPRSSRRAAIARDRPRRPPGGRPPAVGRQPGGAGRPRRLPARRTGARGGGRARASLPRRAHRAARRPGRRRVHP